MASLDELFAIARTWLVEHGCSVATLSDSEVLDALRRCYVGGVEGLVRDLLPGGA